MGPGSGACATTLASPLCRLASFGLAAPFPLRLRAKRALLHLASLLDRGEGRSGWRLHRAPTPAGAGKVTLGPLRVTGSSQLLLEAPLTLGVGVGVTEEAYWTRGISNWGTCRCAAPLSFHVIFPRTQRNEEIQRGKLRLREAARLSRSHYAVSGLARIWTQICSFQEPC